MSTNVITLENLAEHLPQWTPSDGNHLHAIVDMGRSAPSVKTISLFDALVDSDAGFIFPKSVTDDVLVAVSKFHRIADAYGVPSSQFLILATEAMRRASNAKDLLEAIKAATGGLTVQVLEPAVETLLGAVMGSRSGLVDVNDGALFLDLGGGSVQMTWVDTSQPHYDLDAARAGQSLPYGAAKLSRILEDQSPEVQQAEINKLHEGLQQIYAGLCAKFPRLRDVEQARARGEHARVNIFMCGGGFRGYGSILKHCDDISPYPISTVDTYAVSGHRFGKTAKMRRVNEEYEGKIFGMSKRRRSQFPAVATVVEAVIAVLPKIGWVTFCGGSNRQGALMMKLPLEIRESNPLDALARLSPSEKAVCDAVGGLLQSSVPREVDPETPTILTTGSLSLFVKEIWKRSGYDDDTNAGFAIHDAISRDSDAPGLTHLARAVLGLTVCARWGQGIGPAEEPLYKGLRDILEQRQKGATFWSVYIGAVSKALATVFTVMPSSPDQLKGISFASEMVTRGGDKRDKLALKIRLAPELARQVDTDELIDDLESVKGKKGDKDHPKVHAKIEVMS